MDLQEVMAAAAANVLATQEMISAWAMPVKIRTDKALVLAVMVKANN